MKREQQSLNTNVLTLVDRVTVYLRRITVTLHEGFKGRDAAFNQLVRR